jgi:hypothetical protein
MDRTDSNNGRCAMPWAVPIRVVDESHATVTGMVAVFYWLDASGEIGKVVEQVPIENGVAVYNGGPLPHGAFFGITVHEGTGLPVFRSGRLAKLPGPPSEIVATSRIEVFHASTGANFGLTLPDGMPELVGQRLSELPSSFRIEQIEISADNAGHEVVTVRGQVKQIFWFAPFSYALPLTLHIASEPGHPENVVSVEPATPEVFSGPPFGNVREVLKRAVTEGVKRQLEAAIRHIATLQQLARGIDFPATLVSVTRLSVVPNIWDPSISMLVHGGAITGVSGDVLASG